MTIESHIASKGFYYFKGRSTEKYFKTISFFENITKNWLMVIGLLIRCSGQPDPNRKLGIHTIFYKIRPPTSKLYSFKIIIEKNLKAQSFLSY